jgi:hypothetical protein
MCVSLTRNDSAIVDEERVVRAKAQKLGDKVVVADKLVERPMLKHRELLPFSNLTASFQYFYPNECVHYCSSPYYGCQSGGVLGWPRIASGGFSQYDG